MMAAYQLGKLATTKGFKVHGGPDHLQHVGGDCSRFRSCSLTFSIAMMGLGAPKLQGVEILACAMHYISFQVRFPLHHDLQLLQVLQHLHGRHHEEDSKRVGSRHKLPL